MLLAGYFLPRAEIAANFAFALLCCGVALAAWVDPGLRLAMFMAVGLVCGVVTAVVLVLREGVPPLVLAAARPRHPGLADRRAQPRRLRAAARGRAGTHRPDRGAVRARRARHRPLQADQRHPGPRRGRQRAARCSPTRSRRRKRRSDVFGRIGGEEFAVVLPDTGLEGAATFAEKLRGTLGDDDGRRHRQLRRHRRPHRGPQPCAGCSTAPTSRSTAPSAPAATASSPPTWSWPSPAADVRDTTAVATVSVTFDNLGEAAELERGTWPEGRPLGEHFSVRECLPELLGLLAREDLRATFFARGAQRRAVSGRGGGPARGRARGRLPRLAARAVARRLRRARAARAGARRARRADRLPPARRAAEPGDAGAAERAGLPLLLAGRLARGAARRSRRAAVPLGADRRLLLPPPLRAAAGAQRRPRGADGAGGRCASACWRRSTPTPRATWR